MPSEKHDSLKPSGPKLRRRDPRAWTVPAINHELVTPFRRDFAGARSNFCEGNVESGWHVTPLVLRASTNVDHDRSVRLSETLSELGRRDTS